METVLALTLAFHWSSRRGACADLVPGICSIASAPRANMLATAIPIRAIPIRSGRISLGIRRLRLYRGKARLICRQIIGLRPGYAVGQPQVATRFGCKPSRPQAAIFSYFKAFFCSLPQFPINDPTETQRGRALVFAVCDPVSQT